MQHRWLGLTLSVVVLDQFSKYLVTTLLQPYLPVSVLPFLNFMLSYNPGAAFSFLSGHEQIAFWLFTGLALGVSVGLIIWLTRLSARDVLLEIGLALILAGALGNLIDRLLRGAVVDFIDFHLGTWHFYVFNVADSAITIGAICLLSDTLFAERSKK